MPLIARGIGSGDLVTCIAHGAPVPNVCACCGPLTTTTSEKSPNVFVAGVGVVRLQDKMTAHARNYGPPGTTCNPHAPPCNTASPNVFANSQPVARLGDTYFEVNNHVISTITQSTVFANG